jgi:hypothetical protein
VRRRAFIAQTQIDGLTMRSIAPLVLAFIPLAVTISATILAP